MGTGVKVATTAMITAIAIAFTKVQATVTGTRTATTDRENDIDQVSIIVPRESAAARKSIVVVVHQMPTGLTMDLDDERMR
jgi:hypothetical protein